MISRWLIKGVEAGFSGDFATEHEAIWLQGCAEINTTVQKFYKAELKLRNSSAATKIDW